MSEILYDATCRICTAQAARLERLARHRVSARPLQDFVSDDPRLSQAELLRELKLVTADGRIHGGAEAIVQALRAGRPLLGLVLSAYYLPGVRWLADRAYAAVARNRYCLSGGCDDGCRIPGSQTE